MLFPTVDFAIFFVVVLAISWALRPYALPWRIFIIGASFFFYGFWEIRFTLLLAFSIAFNYLMGLAIYRSMAPVRVLPGRPLAEAQVTEGRTNQTRLFLAAGVAGNLAVLGWFKYYEFFSTSLKNSLADIGIDAPVPLLEITLPIGISFFTFQAISYLVDISRGQIKPMWPLDFATYLSFFPHLVAGPIVRASEFAPQLDAPPRPDPIPVTGAFFLIFMGLFKKVVVSSYLATDVVDPVFALPNEHTSPEILLATYGYAVQIFADFSGYTDIAIGVALLLGFQFPANFNNPYRALSLQDFWRRWHMTLSRWLRDYLYVPLGGSRGTSLFTYRNLIITMVLGGLWHGAAWTFVIWGAIHGAGLVIERLIRGPGEAPASNPFIVGLRWFVTFHVICLAWIFFRAESAGVAFDLLGGLVTSWGSAPLVTPLAVLAIVGMIAWHFLPDTSFDTLVVRVSQINPLAQAAGFAGGIVLIDALGPSGVAPFIYFQF
jgi:D-alanyl-lipoteichoic acid acyltransferase DltB (MBOAT superfamily)